MTRRVVVRILIAAAIGFTVGYFLYDLLNLWEG